MIECRATVQIEPLISNERGGVGPLSSLQLCGDPKGAIHERVSKSGSSTLPTFSREGEIRDQPNGLWGGGLSEVCDYPL